MWTPLFFVALSFLQAAGAGTPQGQHRNLQAALARASKEADLNRAGSILWSSFTDEAAIRSALLTSEALDERSIFILFGGHWGSHARVPVKNRPHWQRIVVGAVATKPTLIRSVIRAERYDIHLRNRILLTKRQSTTGEIVSQSWNDGSERIALTSFGTQESRASASMRTLQSWEAQLRGH